MANALFAWQRLSEGTLSGGSWLAALPVTNVLDTDVSVVARSSSDANADTIINRDYGAATTLRLVAVCKSNLQKDATWRIRASANADMSSPVLDTGWIACWPVQWASGVLPTGHVNVADRLFTNADIARLRWDVLYIAANDVSARYWRIEFDDDGNTDTYVEIGYLVMAPVYQVSANMVYGAEWGMESETTTGTADNGRRLVNRKAHRRTFVGAFDALRTNEGFSVLRDALDEVGQSDPIYFVFDPSDTELLQRRSFLALQKTLSTTRIAMLDQAGVGVALEEVL